ncbi:MAG: hypothetical protein AB4352_21000 [Hormoscilla sp.]
MENSKIAQFSIFNFQEAKLGCTQREVTSGATPPQTLTRREFGDLSAPVRHPLLVRTRKKL